jgi:hypothetical protein
MWSDVEWWGMSSDMDTNYNSQYNSQYTIHTLCTLCLFSYSLRFTLSAIRSPVTKVPYYRSTKQAGCWLALQYSSV